MPSRLSRALRELAAALEEEGDDGWELVAGDSPRRRLSSPPAARSAPTVKAAASPPASSSLSTASAGSPLAATTPAPAKHQLEQATRNSRLGGAAARGRAVVDPSSGELPAAKVCGSHVSYHQDIRHYIVLECPDRPSFVGYVSGPASSTWRTLERSLPTGQLYTSHARLRRVADRRQAEQVWQAAFPGIPMPMLPM